MSTDISVPATFRFNVPGKPDDPVVDYVQVAEDRLVAIRINEHGQGMLSFMKKYDPTMDSRDGELIPRATARFSENDLDHMMTEISLSPEALRGLKELLNKHVK